MAIIDARKADIPGGGGHHKILLDPYLLAFGMDTSVGCVGRLPPRVYIIWYLGKLPPRANVLCVCV